MSKIYFGNDLNTPEGLTHEEEVYWHYRMVGGAAAHIPPKAWEDLRQSCTQAILDEREGGHECA